MPPRDSTPDEASTSTPSGPGIVMFPVPMRTDGPRRDRRGRGLRGPVLVPGLPAAFTRSQAFENHVRAAVARLEKGWSKELEHIEFTVQPIPLSEPAPWESDTVPLGRIFPARDGLSTQIVLYRRPIESRSVDDRDLGLLVLDIIVEQVAQVLERNPEDIDPGYGR